MRRRAFTIVEILIVVAIIGIVTAIAFPVFAASKQEAKITTSHARLRQCALAVHLYMGDAALETTPHRLPDGTEFGLRIHKGGGFHGVTPEVMRSACWHPDSRGGLVTFLPNADDSPNASYGGRFISEWRATEGERAVLFSDDNCNPAEIDLKSDYTTKLGLGVLVNTTLVRKRAKGMVGSITFWNPKP